VSREPPDKPSHPLWRYMRSLDVRPPPARPRGAQQLPPRMVEAEDLELLRDGDDWAPTQVLRRFGPARTEQEHLPRLIVAAGILEGPHRLRELSERLLQLDAQIEPRLRGLLVDDALGPRRGFLETVVTQLGIARLELPQTRARAANNAAGVWPHPDGLRFLDLDILVTQTETAVLAQELSGRRNVTGLDFARAVVGRPPELRYAESWLERLYGTVRLGGVLLYRPEEFGRVLLVREDGRLAYDPGAVDESERDL
jgi:hypothetical protein